MSANNTTTSYNKKNTQDLTSYYVRDTNIKEYCKKNDDEKKRTQNTVREATRASGEMLETKPGFEFKCVNFHMNLTK